MAQAAGVTHWLNRYATDYHQWRQLESPNGAISFTRPQGLVESSFDTDGRYFEGRADISTLLTLDLKTRLSRADLQHRILLCWTALRLHHVLLRAQAVVQGAAGIAHFKVAAFGNAREALTNASSAAAFIPDTGLSDHEFYIHVQNTARAIRPDVSLSRLMVLPIQQIATDRLHVKFFFVMAHQIADGVSNRLWLQHFIDLMNMSEHQLSHEIETNFTASETVSRLPRAQEDLYPRISGSKARQHWFWLLSRILRHVRKPLPEAFPNPLRRLAALKETRAMPSHLPEYLDYSKKPPLNSFTIRARLSASARDRLVRLCREAKVSIGAGCFTLVAIVMMSFHEERNPEEAAGPHARPFICGFPINPRAFFNHTAKPDSLMLAFCDGILMPFLPSHLDLDGRFRLLARQTHRQLAAYQKRDRPEDASNPLAYMGSRGAGRIISMNYISAVERLKNMLPVELSSTLPNPQGGLPMRRNASMSTCGVSSLGRTTMQAGLYDLTAALDTEDSVIADFKHMRGSVRAREGEFLVGVVGDDTGIGVGVSFDGNAIDESRAEEWMRRIETLFDPHYVSVPKL